MVMGFFPHVAPILMGLDRRGLATLGEQWDAAVRTAIVGFSGQYNELLKVDRKLIDYSDLATQTAYVFMYVAGHADFLSQVLAKGVAANMHTAFRKEELRVTSLGGGPGSDLLALVRVIRDLPPEERPGRLRYRVLDKQPNWHEILRVVAAGQLGTLDIELSFEAIDVTKPPQCSHPVRAAGAATVGDLGGQR